MRIISIIKELPNAHQHFHAVNSGACRHSFYPYKAQILKRYGVPDGYDVQRIKKECWVCKGEGVSFNPFSQRNPGLTLVFCRHCNGTGLYRNSTHYLQRYRLGDRIYHTPTPKDELIGDEREAIRGFVEHSYVSPYPDHELSIQVCLLRWLPSQFLAYFIQDARKRWQQSDDYWRYKFHRRWVKEAWKEDDSPF